MCEHVSETVFQFIHTKLHSNTPYYHYQCGVPDYTRMYRKATIPKTHLCRQPAWPAMVYKLPGQMVGDASSSSNSSGRLNKTITRGQKRYGHGSGGPNAGK